MLAPRVVCRVHNVPGLRSFFSLAGTRGRFVQQHLTRSRQGLWLVATAATLGLHASLGLGDPPAAALGQRQLADDYDLGPRIGKGASAVVRRGRCRRTGREVAIKEVAKSTVNQGLIETEIQILRKVGSNPHVAKLIDVFESRDAYFLVMELAHGGELFERLAAKGAYSERQAAAVVRQIGDALAFLHAQGVSHRDLKPENILLVDKSDASEVRVVDFGLSRCEPRGQGLPDAGSSPHAAAGTWAYWPPEAFRTAGQSGGAPMDMWALGCVLYILLCGFHPFDPQGAASDRRVREAIGSARYDFADPAWRTVSPEAQQLVAQLLCADPQERLTVEGLLTHPWIAGDAASGLAIAGSDARLREFALAHRRLRATAFAIMLRAARETRAGETDEMALRAAGSESADEAAGGGPPSSGSLAQPSLGPGRFDSGAFAPGGSSASLAQPPPSAVAAAAAAGGQLRSSKASGGPAFEAELLASAFRQLDSQGRGFFDSSDLRRVMRDSLFTEIAQAEADGLLHAQLQPQPQSARAAPPSALAAAATAVQPPAEAAPAALSPRAAPGGPGPSPVVQYGRYLSMMASLPRERFGAHERICSEGEAADSFFLIVAGEVLVLVLPTPGTATATAAAAAVAAGADQVTPRLEGQEPWLRWLPAPLRRPSWPALGLAGATREPGPAEPIPAPLGPSAGPGGPLAGQEREVARLRSGEFFGETALLTGGLRTASCVAGGLGAEVLKLDREDFQALVGGSPTAAGAGAEAQTQGLPLALNFIRLAGCTQRRSLQPGEAVFEQGEQADAFFIVSEGQLRVEVDGVEVGRLGAGECFGEMGILSGSPRNATVRAHTAASCLALPAADLRSLLFKSAAVRDGLAAVASLRDEQMLQHTERGNALAAVPPPLPAAVAEQQEQTGSLSHWLARWLSGPENRPRSDRPRPAGAMADEALSARSLEEGAAATLAAEMAAEMEEVSK